MLQKQGLGLMVVLISKIILRLTLWQVQKLEELNNSDDKSNNLKKHKDHLLDNLVIVHVSHNYIHKLIDEV